MTQREFSRACPRAFEMLPSAYRGDDCLEFYYRYVPQAARTLIFCAPREDQVDVLGDWECVYDSNAKQWIKYISDGI